MPAFLPIAPNLLVCRRCSYDGSADLQHARAPFLLVHGTVSLTPVAAVDDAPLRVLGNVLAQERSHGAPSLLCGRCLALFPLPASTAVALAQLPT